MEDEAPATTTTIIIDLVELLSQEQSIDTVDLRSTEFIRSVTVTVVRKDRTFFPGLIFVKQVTFDISHNLDRPLSVLDLQLYP